MSDFSPVQLDALEDALEDLERIGVSPEAGVAGGPDVAQRLEEYREIMQWTRESMPLVDVTSGLLDSVLEEARGVTPIAVAATEAPAAEEASWWKKLRGVFLLPALAVAGSAALVLMFFVPLADKSDEVVATRAGEAPAIEAKSQTAAADAPAQGQQPAGALDNGLADASVDQELSRGRLRLEEADASERGAAAEAKPERMAEAEEIPNADPPPPPPAPAKAQKPRANEKVLYDDAVEGKKKSPSSGGAPGGSSTITPSDKAPKESESPAAPPAPTDPAASSGDTAKQKKDVDADDDGEADGWGTIAAGDNLRRAGNCASAKTRYKSMISATDRRVRARALAGLGLCEEASGNEKSAESYFSKARKADADIAGFIAHERPQQQAAPPQADALE